MRRSKALITAVRAATVTDSAGSAVDLSDLLGEDEEPAADIADIADETDTADETGTPDEAGDVDTAADTAGDTADGVDEKKVSRVARALAIAALGVAGGF